MQLEYRILWFEDQPTNIKPYEENVRNNLARLGFIPKLLMKTDFVVGADVTVGLPPRREVDLILMDWKLGGGHDGASLAHRVRQLYSDTDIIFYSSEPPKTLRRLIFDQDIDGVYCVSRTSLSDRTMSIIRAQMRKVLDLNHMRGIVIAATSDLDHVISECLDVVRQVVYPTDPNAFALVISTQVVEGLQRKAVEIELLGKKGKLEKLIKDPNFGSALRLATLQSELKKLSAQITEVHLIEKLSAYLPDVITPRNDFAHRRAIVDGESLRLEGRDDPFTQDSMVDLRRRLLDHAENLGALLTLLKEMALAANEQALADQIGDVQQAVGQVVGSSNST